MKTTTVFDNELIVTLQRGGVAVVKTDTLYGIVASAAKPEAVQRVYTLKNRNPDKACIILIGDESQILPESQWSERHQALARKYWPGPVSIIVPVSDDFPGYLRRAETSIAYRLPANEVLRQLLLKTGPLVAPSANPESSNPAATIAQAQQYFGDGVDTYVDHGPCGETAPSKLIALDENGEERRLR